MTVLWFFENVIQQLFQMMPCMALSLIVWSLLRPARLRQLRERGLTSPRRREAVLLLYVLFCAGLCALTLFPYGFWRECLRVLWEPGYRPVIHFPTWEQSLQTLRGLPASITPFREILRVNQGGPWLRFVFWGNIIMFAPIGFCLPLLWRHRRWYHAAALGLVLSTGIEFIQVFSGRVSDIDDVMLNTLGTIFGFLLFYIVSKVVSLDWNSFLCQEREAE